MPRFLALVALALLPGIAVADVRVVDGDTLEIDGTVFRLNGIDAPEHGQQCGNWNCGVDATETLVALVRNRQIACDPISEDGYGRVIATCYADGIDIGAEMVDKGMAWAFLKYSDAYEADELNAKSEEMGIWSGDYLPPWEFRSRRWTSAAQTAPEGCPIKGNISQGGRIYHTPWSPWYARTRINTSKGERWFCTEAEAVAAGWRAARWN